MTWDDETQSEYSPESCNLQDARLAQEQREARVLPGFRCFKCAWQCERLSELTAHYFALHAESYGPAWAVKPMPSDPSIGGMSA